MSRETPFLAAARECDRIWNGCGPEYAFACEALWRVAGKRWVAAYSLLRDTYGPRSHGFIWNDPAIYVDMMGPQIQSVAAGERNHNARILGLLFLHEMSLHRLRDTA